MKIGSHNTMSYLPPEKWWMRPFRFIARCQNKSIEQQLNSGIQYFDIRVKETDFGYTWIFAHGDMTFSGDVYDTLSIIQQAAKRRKIYVRMILEYNRPVPDIIRISRFFINWCKLLEIMYPDIVFFGFHRKYDWEKLYDNGNTGPEVEEFCGSVSDIWWGKLYPRLFAKLFNRDTIKEGTDKEFLVIDFV